MEYKIAINREATGKLPPNARWDVFNDNFENQIMQSLDIANAIYTGHAYSAWHHGRRKVENFHLAQHIAVDLDTEDKRSQIDCLLAHEFVRVYAALLHSTPSHTEATPRTRIVFLLDQPIGNADAYKSAIDFVYSLFPGADPSCVDASRFFYGCKNCRLEWFDNVLPLAHLRTFYQQARRSKPPGQRPPVTRHEGPYSPDKLVEYAVKDAPGKGRNNTGYYLARRLRENGVSQDEAFNWMLHYQRQVQAGAHKYTQHEAVQSLKSAYR